MMLKALPIVLVAAGVAYATWEIKPEPAPIIETKIVTKTQIEKGEPKIEYRWRDRIVKVRVPTTTVAIAPDGGEQDIATFCGGAGWVPPSDSLSPVGPPQLLLRSGVRSGKRYDFRGPASDRSLRMVTKYGVKGTKYGWRVTGDSLIFEQPRFWFLGSCLEDIGFHAGQGALLGDNAGSDAVLGAGIGIARCAVSILR